ncbi:MAG: hypothetical protein KBS65_01020, partial [Prevotella sp.]|nr:hypothetical protein [Candidatus Equicola stercoris]
CVTIRTEFYDILRYDTNRVLRYTALRYEQSSTIHCVTIRTKFYDTLRYDTNKVLRYTALR